MFSRKITETQKIQITRNFVTKKYEIQQNYNLCIQLTLSEVLLKISIRKMQLTTGLGTYSATSLCAWQPFHPQL